MLNAMARLFNQITLTRPWITWVLLAAILGTAGFYAQNFRLDASADSLLLENDEDLQYFRETVKRYGADDFFIVTYTPKAELFSRSTLQELKALRDELSELASTSNVVSILDVPLIASPPVTISEVQKETRTLLTPGMDLQMARRELLSSPLYKDLLVDREGKTTVMQITLPRDETYFKLLNKRRALEEKRTQDGLDQQESIELDQVSEAFTARNRLLQYRNQALIKKVRRILHRYEDNAEIFLGGIPLITADMTNYVRSDIRIFGIGIATFIIVLLALAFHKLRWVIITTVICGMSTVGMLGILGFMDWPVTVVSSNFISLALIITLSLVVHLIVRYRELHADLPDHDQKTLIRKTLASKFWPSFFTATTTMVSFASLVVSDIKPVMDFGMMMVWGVGIAFLFTFLLFPSGLVTLVAGSPSKSRKDFTSGITDRLSKLVAGSNRAILMAFALLVMFLAYGLTQLTVENRFIDYFKSSTEIYQGMYLIDRKLGGTTPLDVVLDADPSFFEEEEDDFGFDDEGVGLTGSSYWFNSFQLEEVKRIHEYLDALPETGKVLSLATTMSMLSQLNKGEPLDDFALAVMIQRLPDSIKNALFNPYMSEDGNQIRFNIRIIDSAENLNRADLLKKVRQDLQDKFNLAPEQVHLTSMLVLYNNVLQSLFQSQILTLGVVFIAIFLMLLLLFRSPLQAFLGAMPTFFSACFILGLMGWLEIPLDIMTITIAAITIGIGVDDAIHYIHRFREEFATDRSYVAAMRRSHMSVGQAMIYTSVIVTIGFSILTLSNFIPSIYFGLLTGLAMIIAMLANLTLLPALLIKAKAFK